MNVTIVTVQEQQQSHPFSSLPCMSDSYHVYGITCFINTLLLLLPRQVWPVQSFQHNVYISWNISILAMHIYWFYQSGYRVLNESQIFFIISLFFLLLVYGLYYFQIRYHWIVSLLTVAVLWTYEASSFMQLIGLAFVVLLAIVIGIICFNASWYCARFSSVETAVTILEAFTVGTIAAFSLRFVIEQQPPNEWTHVGTTQVCCTNNIDNNAEQFSTDCPLSLTWVVITGCIVFTIVRLTIGYITDKLWISNKKRQKEEEKEQQRIYKSYLEWLQSHNNKQYSLLHSEESLGSP